MSGRVFWSKAMLGLHLFVCCVWLYLFRTIEQPPNWTIHIFALSLLVIQFTWGVTVGLTVGPSRKRRPLLWWSLMTAFMPLLFISSIVYTLLYELGWFGALLYFAAFLTILASETYTGVMLGVRWHSELEK